MQDEHRYGKEKEEENQNDENIFKKKTNKLMYFSNVI